MHDGNACLQDKKYGEVAPLETMHVQIVQILQIQVGARFLGSCEITNTIQYYHYDKRHLKYYALYSSINDPHPQVFPFPLFLVEQITGSRVVEPISDLIPHDPFHNVHFFGWGNLLIGLVQWNCIILPTLIHHYPVKGFYRGTICNLSI